MLQTKKIEYSHQGKLFEGYCAYDDRGLTKKPAVLSFHDWSGRNDLACQKVEQLAELGYVGFAVDLYGKGVIGETKEEKSALIQPLLADRKLLQERILAALATVQALEYVNTAKIAAIGFCFGGLCALDLARSDVEVRGVVSFHGLLNAPANQPPKATRTKILVLHGHDDPMVPPEQVLAFETEMTSVRADWQLIAYGNTMHGFTNPQANDPAFGTVYNALVNKRSWLAMKRFLEEIF